MFRKTFLLIVGFVATTTFADTGVRQECFLVFPAFFDRDMRIEEWQDLYEGYLATTYPTRLGPNGGTGYWMRKAKGGVSYGGNAQGLWAVEVDGVPVTHKTHVIDYNSEGKRASFEEMTLILRQMDERYAEGRGPRLLGIGLEVDKGLGQLRLKVVAEDLHAPTNEFGKKVVTGNSFNMPALVAKYSNSLSKAQKQEIYRRVKLEHKLHTDPSTMNVMFRVIEMNRDAKPPKNSFVFTHDGKEHCLQILAVDASGRDNDPAKAPPTGYDADIAHVLKGLATNFGIDPPE